ncbi:AIG2 family protein [Actinokineospora auranticolor]|uniref:AIG2 family protein n=1 Tax=Actinokineospora auranticolor TaxID=155976 RepID=A0A2S6GWX9_9PSEU|nr:AIG2 family protein [Actinokineospora auranticolor]
MIPWRGCLLTPHCVARLCRVPLYAAYGSNMDPGQMMQRAPHSPMAGTGWLVGWRLTFGGEDLGWEGALATIVEDPGSQVFVVLYDVTDDEVNLDRWEGSELGLHSKIRLRVQTLEGSVLAWLYVLDAYEGGLPSARYLGVVADAAEAAGAPADYVDGLRTRPCDGIGPATAS